jgi:hypothetical protein
MEINNEQGVQIVVARYKEQLNWLNEFPFNNCSVIIYNKGGDNDYYKSPNIIKEIKLPNIGLDVHSFIYHIINNYDNLANITAFFQGSIELPNKYSRAQFTIIECMNRNTTVLSAEISNEDIKTKLYDFTLDQHLLSHPSVEINYENTNTHHCKIRPFGKWYEELFGDLKTTTLCYNHILAVKREHILRKPKEYYENLLTYLDEGIHPEAVHYFERAWEAVFYPLDINKNYL